MIKPHDADTVYRKLSSDHVSVEKVAGREVLHVKPEALTLLTTEAMGDIAHLLRTKHLEQVRDRDKYGQKPSANATIAGKNPE